MAEFIINFMLILWLTAWLWIPALAIWLIVKMIRGIVNS